LFFGALLDDNVRRIPRPSPQLAAPPR